MDPQPLNLRAVIFDVYGTLLDVTPAPPDAAARWTHAYETLFHTTPALNLHACAIATAAVIARHHADARAHGIPWPEIQWPSVVAEVLPEITALQPALRNDFLRQHLQTTRTVQLSPGVARLLHHLRHAGFLLGIASNAQHYTLRELADALAPHHLGPAAFEPDLCFWSYQHGFSKPDPHVFQILTARLQARGIPPAATLMVGDRRDNDIAPARAHGWHAWQVGPPPNPGWDSLTRLLPCPANP